MFGFGAFAAFPFMGPPLLAQKRADYMAKLSVKAGATSQTIDVFIQSTASIQIAGLTGLVFNSSGLTAYYNFPQAASVQITLATLAAVTSAWSSGGFKEIDATNMPGVYRLDLPNAALAAASGRYVTIYLQGAANMTPTVLEIELTGWDNQDAVHGGMSALPNATAGANTGLPVVGTQVPNATAGAVNGLFISGANTGPVSIASGMSITGLAASGGTPATEALKLTGGVASTSSGGASAAALKIVGGAGAASNNGGSAGAVFVGASATAGGGSGTGILIVGGSATTDAGGLASPAIVASGGSGASSTNGAAVGVQLAGGGTNTVATTASALQLVGTSTGHGLECKSGTGATGNGINATSNATNGSGMTLVHAGTGSDFNATTTNALQVDVNTIKTQTVTCAAGVTVGAFVGNATAALAVDASGRIDLGKILGTASTGTAGYVGIDWGHVNAPTTTVGLTGTTIATSQVVASVTGAVGSVTGAVGSVTGNVGGNVTGSVGSVVGAVGSVTGNVGGNVVGSVASVTAAVSLSAGESWIIQTGTAGAGGASTITLATAVGTTADLVGCLVKITSGTGANQTRVITGYVNSTKVVTVDYAWVTQPDATSVYAVLFDNAPVLNSSLQVTAASTGGTVTANVTQIAGQTASAATGVTFPGTIASPTNITAGTITTATNLTNAPTAGDFTATMKTSLNAATPASIQSVTNIVSGGAITTSGGKVSEVTLVDTLTTYTGNTPQTGDVFGALPAHFSVLGITAAGKISEVVLTDTLTTYTGNTPQTGDSFARIGATGSGLTSLAPSATALSTAQWTNSLATNLGTLAGHDPGTTIGTSTLTQTQVTGGAYSVQSSSCVLGDARIANLDATVSSRAPASTALSTAQWTTARAGYLDNLSGGAVALESESIIIFNAVVALGSPMQAGSTVTITGTTGTLDALQTALSSTHGAGSWATATGFSVPGDAMALTGPTLTTITTDVATQITTDHGSGSYLTATGFSTFDPTTTGVFLTAAGLDGVTVEAGVNARQALSAIGSSVAGTLSGATTPTVTTFAMANPGTARLTVSVDAANDRTAIVYNLPP